MLSTNPMKCLILFSLAIITINVTAETNYVLGAATYHMRGTYSYHSKNFRNKWSKDGRLIGTPLVAVEIFRDELDGYSSTKYFVGQNSVGGAMAGRFVSSGKQWGLFRAGLLGGIYAQDASRFYKLGMIPFGLPVGQHLHLAPLMGIELIYGSAVRWHLKLTPMLAISYISFCF